MAATLDQKPSVQLSGLAVRAQRPRARDTSSPGCVAVTSHISHERDVSILGAFVGEATGEQVLWTRAAGVQYTRMLYGMRAHASSLL